GERTEAHPEDEKYTLAGLKDLKRFVRYATGALHIKSWHKGDYNRPDHMEPGGGDVAPGFGELLWAELEPLTATGLSICCAYTRWISAYSYNQIHTVLDDMTIAKEEICGPVIFVLKFRY
nr:hypothetical protein [Tanacetum cinerariifolium]